ncbi:hypothetical protein [Lishizhenia sp.]|uniref:hypothetical protein n=1 Tax=Lishizhenia sp. TaxID=2497594 RepID=UPI00299DB874|nr:hypothetical protein [Lishizhenia sp.]MDX1445722.1 hypothetical protein [Lishizhenia sp.]
MKYSFLFFPLLFSSFLFSQMAIVKDKDGWTNLRKSANAHSEIIYKVYENEVFWLGYNVTDSMLKHQEWIPVLIPKNKFSFHQTLQPYISGFIHRSRLMLLDELEEYAGNDFSFQYFTSPFDSTHKIIDTINKTCFTRINGRPIWGTDGNLPKTQVDSIAINLNGTDLHLHHIFYSDIYECTNNFTIYKSGDIFFVYQYNSDGAGFYEILWVFNEKGLMQRLIDNVI